MVVPPSAEQFPSRTSDSLNGPSSQHNRQIRALKLSSKVLVSKLFPKRPTPAPVPPPPPSSGPVKLLPDLGRGLGLGLLLEAPVKIPAKESFMLPISDKREQDLGDFTVIALTPSPPSCAKEIMVSTPQRGLGQPEN
ncbi:hypothetical protein HGRIS_013722 [Hohenbuehelia grisea]|uniref:Uncharacterized protein n=1 Tax=Hohenbuehelia grisea TaxID=104357 RepID=A0ABR3IWL2_9AGAR